jgi:hypothetical protein
MTHSLELPAVNAPSVLPQWLQMGTAPLGKPRILMNGDHLDIRASVDLAGLKQLQAMLKKYEEILQMMAPQTKRPPHDPI